MTSSIIVYLLSLFFLIAFIAFRVFELNKGTIFFAKERKFLDRYLKSLFDDLLVFFLKIPRVFSIKKATHVIAHHGVSGVASVANVVEKQSHALAMRLSKRVKELDSKRDASDFLRKVSEHRKALNTDELRERTKL